MGWEEKEKQLPKQRKAGLQWGWELGKMPLQSVAGER